MRSDHEAETVEELLAHGRWVRALARRLVATADLAEDAEQQAWLAAIERPPSRRGDLRAWLGRVLRRRVFDLSRGDRRRVARERKAGRPRREPSPEELLSQAETRARIGQAVLALDEPYRSTVMLRYLQELSPGRVAALQGVPVSTVNTRLARGLQRLRARLREEIGEGSGGWRAALLPLLFRPGAGLSPLSLGSVVMSTTKARIASVLVALLLLAGLAGVGAGLFFGDGGSEESEPAAAVARSGAETATSEAPPARLGGGGGTAGTDGAGSPAPAPVDTGLRSAADTIEGRVEDHAGRAAPFTSVLLWALDGHGALARTQTDREGRFAFADLADETYRVTVHAAGKEPVLRTARPGGSLVLVTLEAGGGGRTEASSRVEEGAPLPAGVVAGTVCDDEDRPLPAALVMLCIGHSITRRMDTDDTGAYRFEDVEDGHYVLAVYARGWARAHHPVRPGERRLRVHLERAPSLGGVVVAADTGEPIAGVRITALSTEPSVPMVIAETEADGTFRLGGLSPGRSILDVGRREGPRAGPAADFVAVRLGPFDAGRLDLRIELARGLAISGEIRGHDGQPWAGGAQVLALPVSEDGAHRFDGARAAPAAPDGSFSVPGLPPGRYDLTVTPEATGGAPSPASVQTLAGIPAGTSGLLVTLEAGVPLEVRLVDDAGAPVPGRGWVWVRPTGTEAGEPGSVRAEARGGGVFRTPPLDPGLAYDVTADGFAGHRRADLRGVHADDADVVLVLERCVQVRGRVVVSSGEALGRNVPVTARATGDHASAVGHEPWAYVRKICAPDGRFTIDGLKEGIAYEVAAGGGESGLVPSGDVVVVTAPASDVVVRVEAAVSLSGRLVDEGGRGVPGVTLRARSLRGGPVSYARTRDDGSFRFEGLPAGPVRLACTYDDRRLDLGSHDAPAEDLRLEVGR